MAFAIVWRPRALRAVLAAQRWWMANRGASPRLLRDELARVTALLAERPYIGPAIRGRDARRVVLDSTGYVLVYRVRPRATRVEVVDFVHGSRRPPP